MSLNPIRLAANCLYRLTPLDLLRRVKRPSEHHDALVVFKWTGIAVAVIWAVAAGALYDARYWTLNDRKTGLERMAQVVEVQVRTEMEQIRLFSNLVGSHYRHHAGLDPRKDAELKLFVDQLRSGSKGHIDVHLVTNNGDAYAAFGEKTAPLANVGDRDYFKAQQSSETRGFFIGMPVLSRITNRLVFPISYPLPGTPGGIAMLSVTMEAFALESFYDASRVGQHGSITLLHRDGTILFRIPANQPLIGKSVTQEELWTAGLKEQSHGVIVLDKSPFNDSRNFAAYVALDDFPLVVVVTETLEDVLAQWRKLLHIVLTVGVLLTTMVLLLAHHLIRRIGELSVTRNELEQLAQTDPLTGLFNRRHFWTHGAAEIARISRYVRPLSVLSIDLDHFKQVNDRYGHAAGDEALRWLAKVLVSSLRQADVAARLGGEEFAVLLPETSLDNAERLAERIRSTLAATPVTAGDKKFSITASIGVASAMDVKTTLEALLLRADQALYQAKEGGRNRTVAAAIGETTKAQDVG